MTQQNKIWGISPITTLKLDPTIQALQQMSPANQDLIIKMVESLAEREGIRVANPGTMGLTTPAEGIPLWEIMLTQERYSPRTITMYVQTVSKYLRADPTPTTLTIRAYLAKRLKDRSSAMVANELKALRNFFSYLYREGLWTANPVNGIKSIPVTYRRRECPEPETVMAILKSKPIHSRHILKFRMMTVLLVGTAMRITEAAGIERTNINLRQLEITIIGKGRKERTVPIDGMVASMLQQYMQANPTDTPYLFPAKEGDRGFWDIRSYEKTLMRVCKRGGLPHTTPHQLRHFYATYALMHGAKIEVISRILGHASVAITLDIYRHVSAKEMHTEHETFSPFSQMQKMLPVGETEKEGEA